MKKVLSILCTFMIILSMSVWTVSADSLEDGAYLVSRQTSYADPETGSTADGGTNIALGDSMCASIVEEQLLVEQTDGRTYVTMGMGLMSNIENVRIQVQDQNGDYHDAELTMTGTCQRDGDTCNHYRFEVFSAANYIRPIIYVTPMGRDVQFFVMPDVSSAQEGTGNFVSEMVGEDSQPESSQQEGEHSAETSDSSVSVETLDSSVSEEEAAARESTDLAAKWIVVLAVMGVGIWYFGFFKRKRK